MATKQTATPVRYGVEEPDAINPAFMFQTIETTLLVQAVRGEIDINALVRQELANRGLNWSGKWVGFEKAGFLAKCYPTRINGKLVPVSVPESE